MNAEQKTANAEVAGTDEGAATATEAPADAPPDAPAETVAAAEAVAPPESIALPEPAVAPEPAEAPGPSAPVVPAPARLGPGERLRAAREARLLGIQQVTDLLHIEPRLLQAMEDDDFGAFDAPVYARGFLRKYAAFLELSDGEIVAAYERLHAGPGAPSLIPPATAEEPRRDWSVLKLPAALAGVLVLVGGSYWWWLTRPPESGAERAPAVAAAPAASASRAAVPTATGAAATTIAGGTDDAAVPQTASPVGATSLTTSAAVPATGAGAAAPGVATGAVAPPAALPSGAALEIDFVSDCWVEVYGPNGARLMYDLGTAGTSRALPGPGPWRVFLGAADGARLRVSGRPVVVPAANRSGATARLTVGPDGSIQ